MSNLNELISMPVLALNTGKKLGIVKNIVIENFKLSKLHCFNDESETEEDFFVNTKSVLHFGENAITLKDDIIETCENDASDKIIGASVYNQEGLNLGSVSEISFDEKSKLFNLTTFKSKNVIYTADEIATITDGVIILKGKVKIKSVKSPQALKSEKTDNQNVKILNGEIVVNKNAVFTTTTTTTTTTASDEVKEPKKAYADFDFLVGRKMSSDLYTKEGKKILNNGDRINSNILAKAIVGGYLMFIMKNSSPFM